MKLQFLGRLALISTVTVALSACGKNFGPIPVELRTLQKFELATTEGKRLELEAGQTLSAQALYRAQKNLIEITLGQEKVQFKKAKFDKDLNQVIVDAKDSNQGVGVTITKTLVCTPECEHQEVRVFEQVCTYYVNSYGQHCRYQNGRHECSPQWGWRPQVGRQQMKSVLTTRVYSVQATLADRSSIELAKASGTYRDQSQETYPVGPCF